ncbi:type I polyketide synthase [Gaopeijia maritima]|uniref:SDR family NAD(P)-dependent oxidoreductase n=1 Tax=Gaopeijia maritima TaxID=3119007 RepID=A0ABU9E9S7_9BACT
MSETRDVLRRALEAIDDLTERLHAAESRRHEPIAVVGMACRFPGGADTPDRYWRLIRDAASGIVEVPADRWAIEGWYDPELKEPGTSHTRFGGFVGPLDGFDAAFFGVAPREAATLDPQQRLLLECTWEALERSGEAPDRLKGSATGVYVGITASDYGRLLRIGRDDSDVYAATGTALNAAAGRLSFVLGLQGPAMAIDTACSSSLVATHLACAGLRAGDCDRAVVGGVNAILSPEPFALFSRWGMISNSEECRTFDAGASGFVRGEGCGVLVLKRLSDAQAAGDPIVAVIRGTAVNQDGPSSGLSVPNGPAQVKVIEAALSDAGLQPHEVDFVEAHGTGTPLGDPIEVEALGEAYGSGRRADDPLMIGSVKPNVGHLESAAGVAGLMKLILALRAAELPAQRYFDEPNPRIDWSSLPVRVVDERRDWPARGERRRGAVSSFGFSGTNAHVIVESAPEPSVADAPTATSTPAPLRPRLVPLSGRSEEAVREAAAALAAALDADPALALDDVERTAMTGRSHFPWRAVAVAADRADLVRKLRALAAGEEPAGTVIGRDPAHRRPKVAALFTGQGAQYPGMGLALRDVFPAFREAWDRMAEVYRAETGGDLTALVADEGGAVHGTEVTQPALYALQRALAALFDAWGVRPEAVLGHSVGEFAAACGAGVFSEADGMRIIAARGRLMGALPAGGGMIAVAAPADEVRAAIEPWSSRVGLAALNGPADVVVSGDLEWLAAVEGACAERGWKSRRLEVSHAFHSHRMDPVLPDFRAVLERAALSAPRLPLASNVEGSTAPDAGSTVEYWLRHLREPVRFEEGMRALVEAGVDVHLELGPRPTLLGMAGRFLPPDSMRGAPSLRRAEEPATAVLLALGRLYVAGVDPQWEGLLQGAGRRVALPTYPFQRRRYWAASKPVMGGAEPAAPTADEAPAVHPLLGPRFSSPAARDQFACTVDPRRVPWLSEHRVAGATVFPATAHLELMRAAAALRIGGAVEVESLTFAEALVLDGGSGRDVRAVIADDEGADTLQIWSRPRDGEGEWTLHATGRLRAAAPGEAPAADEAPAHAAPADLEAYRAEMEAVGLGYGPHFLALREATAIEGSAWGRLSLPEGASTAGFGVHPALLDAAFHLAGLARRSEDGAFWLPVGIRAVRFGAEAGGEVRASCRVQMADARRTVLDLDLHRPDGRWVASVRGLEVRRVERAAFQRAIRKATAATTPDPLLHTAWRAWPGADGAGADGADASGRWALVAPATAELGPLLEAFAAAGIPARTLAASEAAALPSDEGVIDLRAAFADRGPAGRGVVEAVVDGAVGESLALLRARAASGPVAGRFALVTRGAWPVLDADRPDPVGAALWGLGATAGSEWSGAEVVLIDGADPASPEGARALVEVLRGRGRETRFAVRGGDVYVQRLVTGGDAPLPPVAREGEYDLVIAERGDLSGLDLVAATPRDPGPGEVAIRTVASGLNFRDVLNLLDMYPGEPGPLGNECAGWVEAVGEGVDGVAPGDLVACIASSTFGSRVIASRDMVFAVPTALSAAEAAGFAIPHLTAWLALCHIGGMKAGDRVLIHAAAGGVGLAAVHLAHALGATVVGTAGSPEKRRLLEELGVSAVFDSRSTLSADRVREATAGHGVDLVLNSLVGESIDEGLRALAPGGRFLEIGLRELRSPSEIAALRSDIEYTPLILGDWCIERPQAVRAMWSELVALLDAGRIPPPPVRRFRLGEVEAAFRFMARAHHVGRVVITHPDPALPRFRSDATWLVTGGLGALGLQVAEWLADRGARHLLLQGRSEPSTGAQTRIAALAGRGVSVRVVRGDVSEGLPEAAEGEPPLRGVVHCAGVNDDALLANHDADRMRRVLHPKLGGLQAMLGDPRGDSLDHLILFSSGSGLMGAPGQAAYAAANAGLDAWALRRRREGRAGLAVAWGAWAGEGMAARTTEQTRAQWAEQGVGMLEPEQAFAALDAAVAAECGRVAVLPIDWARLGARSELSPFFDELVARRDDGGEGAPADEGGDGAAGELRALPAPERPGALLALLRKEAAAVLGLETPGELDARLGFQEQGMDSLMSVELAGRLSRRIGIELPSTFAFDHPTLQALADYIGEVLFDAPEAGGDHEPESPENDAADWATSLEGLTEDELEMVLRRELDDVDF